MSEVIESFPPQHRGRPPIYDWDKYTDGKIHVCRRGEDFKVPPMSFRALVHHTAKARRDKGLPRGNAKTSISLDKTKVTIQFYDK